ncbi:MAG: hypothetical protein GVY33_02060, partial [Alphaproteobacteria bacterium]|nr:hypothetical protein [Alphaproteobacteria bacterium]
MFYPWYEWQRGFWSPFVEAAAWAARPAQLIAPLQMAGEDLARRLARAGEPIETDLGAFVRGDVGGP